MPLSLCLHFICLFPLCLFSLSLSLNILVLMSPLLMITQCNISILSPSPCLPLSNTHTHTHAHSSGVGLQVCLCCVLLCISLWVCVFSGRLGESDCLASLQQTALFFRLDTIHVHTSWRTDTHTQGRCVSAVKMITANKQSALNAKVAS